MLYFGRCLENLEFGLELYYKILSFRICVLVLLEYFIFVFKFVLNGLLCYMLWYYFIFLVNK